MRLFLYLAATAVIAPCLAARADSYAARKPMTAPQGHEPGARASRAAAGLEKSDPLPAEASASTYLLGTTQLDTLSSSGTASSTTVISAQDGSPLLGVNLPTLSLVDYAGTSICALTSHCSGDLGAAEGVTDVEPGRLEEFVSAIAPEPSSMLLLATGLLGMAGVVRRTHGRRK